MNSPRRKSDDVQSPFTASRRSHTISSSTRALQAIRRPEAALDTCPPSIDDPSDRPNRQTVQTSSTILEHTTRLQIPADELPPLIYSGPMLNHVQRIAEISDCRLHHQLYKDTTGLPRLSSKMHVRPLPNRPSSRQF